MSEVVIMEGSPGFLGEVCTHRCHCSCHVMGSNRDDCCSCTMCPFYRCNRLIDTRLLQEHKKKCHKELVSKPLS